MTFIDVEPSIIAEYEAPPGSGFDEAQLAAASLLTRHSGRTSRPHRQDLRVSSNGLPIITSR